MHFTVAICTWNRAPLLRRTLEHLRAMTVPASLTWDVLVVDNASTDDTPRVIADFTGVLPVRGLHEPRTGVSHARNRAMREARGALIVWTDDDVLVGPGWLSAYARAVREDPDALFYGGPIDPLFEGPLQPHLHAALRQVPFAYAALDHGPKTVALTPEHERWAFTANMAIHTHVQRRYPFDTTLGRRQHTLVGGEDTTLIREIWNAGGRGRWVPEARVRHVIPESRQTIAFLRRYFRGQGAQTLLADPESMGHLIFGVPRSALRTALVHELRYRVRRHTQPPTVWLKELQRAAVAWGYIQAARELPPAQRVTT